MITKIDHVAVIVKDLDTAIKTYSDMFGFEVVKEMEGPGGEFKSVHVRVNDVTLEFLEPLIAESSYGRFLKERGGGLHHISFTTDDIESDMESIQSQGRKLINEKPISLPDARVSYVHPGAAENVLIELMQRT